MSEAVLKLAMQFAVGAIADAIYTEDGLDGSSGEHVLCLLAEALKYGTFDERRIERAEMLTFFHLASEEPAS